MFHVAVFLGAVLLFLIQPLMAKMLLPWFGGGPAIWSTCLVFFQVALVVGYAYAHVTPRVGRPRQVWGHVVLLALALALQPMAPAEAFKPIDGAEIVPRLLTVLTVTVGLPFVLLGATAPMLQDWFARRYPDRSPYGLYVVSNVGALVALVSYPTLVEPRLTISEQTRAWAVLFGVFVVVTAWCGASIARLGPDSETDRGHGDTLDGPARTPWFWWVTLPATGSALLVATTSQLSQDIAALPLIWIVPLALYLVTYIAGFAGWYQRTVVGAILVISVALALYAMRSDAGWSLRAQIVWLLTAFVSAGLVCHGELARLRPGARHLTSYFLAISIGGALGGMTMAILAPVALERYVELPLALLTSCALVAALAARDSLASRRRAPLLAAVALACATVGGATAVLSSSDRTADEVARHRNYYGLLRVREEANGDRLAMRQFFHGRILHGAQFLDGERARQPTTYYGTATGVGLAISRHPARQAGRPLAVGAIGLGAGTLAAYGEPGDTFEFFEIDPAVRDLATTHFSFLRDSRAEVRFVMGDARLSLERQVQAPGGAGRYDVLVVDAFSGDAIPVHLLTRESLALYQRVLKADGIIAVHISNRYLDLQPVVRGLADQAGMVAVVVSLSAVPAARSQGSTWALLTTNADWLAAVASTPSIVSADSRRVVWTDDFSSLLPVLR